MASLSGGNVCMFFMFPRQLSARGQVLAAADRDVQLPYFWHGEQYPRQLFLICWKPKKNDDCLIGSWKFGRTFFNVLKTKKNNDCLIGSWEFGRGEEACRTATWTARQFIFVTIIARCYNGWLYVIRCTIWLWELDYVLIQGRGQSTDGPTDHGRIKGDQYDHKSYQSSSFWLSWLSRYLLGRCCDIAKDALTRQEPQCSRPG